MTGGRESARAERNGRGVPGAVRCGLVEGFYGQPWSHDERLDFLGWGAGAGFDEYLYAPKDDPFHRERWREEYPEPDLARIGELARASTARGVRFTFALHPALDMRFADDDEHRALARKAEQAWRVGVRSFSLLFDDVPMELVDPGDRVAFGDGPEGVGRAHGRTAARFAANVLRPRGIDAPLLVCPTDYAGNDLTPYRAGFRAELPAEAVVLWTGRDIVVGEVTRQDVDAAGAAFGRPLVLWDNFPVNDFDRSRLFLGPLTGRTDDVAGSALVGIVANPMVEPLPSRFALASVGRWAHDPQGYDRSAAGRDALLRVAGEAAERLAPLVRACSAWPPSAPRDPELEAWCALALEGDEAARHHAVENFRLLSFVRPAVPPTPLDNALGPWIDAAARAGAAGALACELLGDHRAGGAAVDEERVSGLQRQLAAVEAATEDVLRPVVASFAHAVLDRLGADVPPVPTRKPGTSSEPPL
ncbi:protein O-GlcNAcase [Isoptericola sp. NPDC056618]|uniref:protein O-GlcNAcase n=1 Tax=Isoptericola sp. NPDC056618 TaxID=3345878 RepID=UPI00368B9EE7